MITERLRRAPRSVSLLDAFEAVARQIEDAAKGAAWPSEKYRTDPVAFCREVIGVEPWSRQIEVLEAVRDYPLVAVASGHKVSKTCTAAVLALWFFSSFRGARIIATAPTARQVDGVFYREARQRHGAARIPLGAQVHELARSGIKGSGFREIIGVTARDQEAIAGISGANLLFIVDEASGVDDSIYEALRGNAAGGARIVAFSNPTRVTGWFAEAFAPEKQGFWHTMRISSEESPNVREGREVIAGLATREWVEEMRAEFGEESPLFRIRVKGEFALAEDGKIISVHAIQQAEARWEETEALGRLHLGVDPAGPSADGANDETAFAVRRGQKVLSVTAQRGLSEDAILVNVLGLIAQHRTPTEPPPIVKVDREGPIGSALFYRLRAYQDANENAFELIAVRASDRAMRQPDIYDRVRDELHAAVAKWINDGGAIPTDPKLARELNATSWDVALNARYKATPKSEIRKELGRSPDRADAVALCIWETVIFVPAQAPAPMADPYASVDVVYGDGHDSIYDSTYDGGDRDDVYGR